MTPIPSSQVLASITLSVSIRRGLGDVYAFLAEPANLSRWATAFCKSIQKSGAEWIVKTETGQVAVRFSEKNDFGILDHYVMPTPEVTIYVPMRVVANGEGSEVIFTLFRQDQMPDATWDEDLGMVRRDLATLKELLQANVA